MATPLLTVAAIVMALTISTTTAMSPPQSTSTPPQPTSTPPQPTSTPPEPTTLELQCRFNNGTVAPGFKPGDMGKSPGPGQCGVCFCDQSGRVECYPPPCRIPPCWDAKSPGPLCCRQCPNGPNCMTARGTIVQEGQEVEEDGQMCTCSGNWDYGGGGREGPMADCRPAPTTAPTTPPTTPAGCMDYNGKVIEGLVPGGHWKSESGCKGCQCDNDWKAMCYVQDCWVTPCVDSIRKPGVCCAICPNGNNCKTPSGKIVKQGEYLMDGSMNCSCTTRSFTKGSEPEAECTISLPLVCRLDNGTVLEGVKPGDSYKMGPCTSCYCQKDGKMMCASMMCAMPLCGPNGHYTREGDCCPRCREGPSGCTLPNGTIAKDLKPGDKYQMGPCTTCICQEVSFKMSCMAIRCAMPFCGDRGYYTPKGNCCPVCRACEDTNFSCRFWASRGECTKNPGWMLTNCKKSCKVKECQSECVDAEPYCNWWSGQEQCEKNPVWMLNKCTKSCNACFPKNA